MINTFLERKTFINILIESLQQYIDNKVNNNRMVFTPNLYHQVNEFMNSLKRNDNMYYFLDNIHRVHYIKKNTLSKKEIDYIIKTAINNYNNDIIGYRNIQVDFKFEDIQKSL